MPQITPLNTLRAFVREASREHADLRRLAEHTRLLRRLAEPGARHYIVLHELVDFCGRVPIVVIDRLDPESAVVSLIYGTDSTRVPERFPREPASSLSVIDEEVC